VVRSVKPTVPTRTTRAVIQRSAYRSKTVLSRPGRTSNWTGNERYVFIAVPILKLGENGIPPMAIHRLYKGGSKFASTIKKANNLEFTNNHKLLIKLVYIIKIILYNHNLITVKLYKCIVLCCTYYYVFIA